MTLFPCSQLIYKPNQQQHTRMIRDNKRQCILNQDSCFELHTFIFQSKDPFGVFVSSIDLFLLPIRRSQLIII